MKILQICNKPPFPPNDGGSIAMNNITYGLLEEACQVKVISLNTKKHFVDIASLPDDYKQKTQIELVNVDTGINPFDAFINLVFTRRSYNLSRFEQPVFEQRLAALLKNEEFDVVIVESVFMNYYTQVIREHSKAKILLRAHNVEFVIWQRLAEEEKNFIKKKYLEILAGRLKREELLALNKFDAILTVSEHDKQVFREHACSKPIESIPISMDVMKSVSLDNIEPEFPSVFFIGSLDWRPNQEGLEWFLREVWPDLIERYPNLHFYIAGRGDASWLDINNYRNIVLEGEIENADDFFKSKAIMIVPLFSGSGMRVKIIEGMTLGKTIVSTSVGAEGIEYENNSNILIADTKKEYFQSVCKLIEDRSFYNQISINAIKNASELYSNKSISLKLLNLIKRL